jgi:2-polyprenyl-6-methoxyphenol hydroxylase-like FAD-dependent oxidoreductase
VIWDVAICGGGPAGLATAIRAAEAGYATVLYERTAGVPDKACGEGLMPRGLAALSRLSVLEAIDQAGCAPFHGIRYVQEDGSQVEARFRDGEGLGIRRLALSRALRERALRAGVELRQGAVRKVTAGEVAATLETDSEPVQARLAVAADGVNSPLRRAAGLDGGASVPRRFGLRRHVEMAPWSDFVEIHWTDGCEAYATPVGPRIVNIAFLWHGPFEHPTWDSLLARFPLLRERVQGAPSGSEERGAGPLAQAARARFAHRLALVGDAAGYVDAITGQGLTLALLSAERLVAALPAKLDDAASLWAALRRYDASLRGEWLRYALPARSLLALARRPGLRQRGVRLCARHPALFAALLRAVA